MKTTSEGEGVRLLAGRYSYPEGPVRIPPRGGEGMGPDTEADELFRRFDEGDGEARDGLFPLIYAELHRLARAQMARQRPGHTLQPTALVHEVFLKLRARTGIVCEDRQHFLRLAATAMRQILIDHARRRDAEKRREVGQRLELDALTEEFERRSGGLLALDAALSRLRALDEDLVRLVELRFFGGLEFPAIAELLGVSLRTAHRKWSVARLILRDELSP